MKQLTTSVIVAARQVDTVAGGLEAIVLALTSRAAGWIACVPTILLTARSCEVIFSLTPMEALASAVALELVGQSTVKTWLAAKEWNRIKRVSDAPASAWLSLIITVGYFVIDFALIAILQVPKARVEPVYYAALLFPLAQVISTITTAERAAQFGREAVAEEDREKRRTATALGKAKAAERREREQAQAMEAERARAQDTAQPAEVSVSFSDNGGSKPYRVCTACGFTAQSPQAWAGHCKGAQHKRNTAELAPLISGNGGHA